MQVCGSTQCKRRRSNRAHHTAESVGRLLKSPERPPANPWTPSKASTWQHLHYGARNALLDQTLGAAVSPTQVRTLSDLDWNVHACPILLWLLRLNLSLLVLIKEYALALALLLALPR